MIRVYPDDEELYECTFCGAVVPRHRRSDHRSWHARLNAKILTTNQIKQLMDLLAERGITDTAVAALDDVTAGL